MKTSGSKKVPAKQARKPNEAIPFDDDDTFTDF